MNGGEATPVVQRSVELAAAYSGPLARPLYQTSRSPVRRHVG